MEENEAELASLGLAEAPKGKKQKLAAKGKGGPAAKPFTSMRITSSFVIV